MTRQTTTAAVALYLLAAAVRWATAPDHHIAEDPFILVESARHLIATGDYRIPTFSPIDASLSWVKPSWPVGFPLLLATAFRLFGDAEVVARLTTIAASAAIAPLALALGLAVGESLAVASLAGLLAALHPLAIGFGGQVFTNNLSLVFFTGALAALAHAAIDSEGRLRRDPRAIVEQRPAILLAALLAGGMLAVRDTDVILGLPLAYLAVSLVGDPRRLTRAAWTTVALAGLMLVVGWAPSLYFNLVNFGSPFVSTHYATGIRLDGGYLLRGSGAFFGLPGIAVMFGAMAACQLPALLIWLPGFSWTPSRKTIGLLAALVAVPILLVNGAFPVASTGAAPRYTLPVTALAALAAAHLLRAAWKHRTGWRVAAACALLLWQAVMLYPPPALFALWPRFAYLAYYSPAYVAWPYRNYPDHTNALVAWVREHTPDDALIVTPSRVHHFYYYGRRAVVVADMLPADRMVEIAGTRPVYVVEDRQTAQDPHSLDRLKGEVQARGFTLAEAGGVDVFTPERGLVHVRAYRLATSR
ncbi:MAG: DUF6798 domain-containing protein [Vicinamibacterales bacterium]